MLDISAYPQSIIIIILRIIKSANRSCSQLILKYSFYFEVFIQEKEEDFYVKIHYF